MKYFIITKRNLIVGTVCVLTAILTTVLSFSGVIANSSGNRKLPIYYVGRDDKTVSISFDAAWGNEHTQKLLDIMKEKNVKSTFFLVGNWVDKYPESVKAIHEAGHDVGNHSDTHPHLPKQTLEKMTSQIEDCNNKIEKIIGVRPTLFRPPYGDYNNDVVETTNKLNMHCIQWDVDSLDWKDPTPEEMLKRIKNKVRSGSIILMHNGAKNTPEALPKIIDMLIGEGYKIVPISELIYKDNYTVEHDGKQINKS